VDADAGQEAQAPKEAQEEQEPDAPAENKLFFFHH
jgi:hypothetical protein